MPAIHATAAPLAGCYVISLRPVGQHASMRRAAARHGASVLALSPWRLVARDDAATRAALVDALANATHVIASSPAAVRAAHGLWPLRAARDQQWHGVGASTARALHRLGIAASSPARMDSEGLLALPALSAIRGRQVALLTAPGGRGVLASALAARGADLLRVDVYGRQPVPPTAQALARLRTLAGPAWLALSSDEALRRVLVALPEELRARLRGLPAVAASARLAAVARECGIVHVVVAGDARPRSLLEAIAAERSADGFR